MNLEIQYGQKILVEAIKGGEKAIGKLDAMALTAPIFERVAFSPLVGEYLAIECVVNGLVVPPNVIEHVCQEVVGKVHIIHLKKANQMLRHWNSNSETRESQEFRHELGDNLYQGFLRKTLVMLEEISVEAVEAKDTMFHAAFEIFS